MATDYNALIVSSIKIKNQMSLQHAMPIDIQAFFGELVIKQVLTSVVDHNMSVLLSSTVMETLQSQRIWVYDSQCFNSIQRLRVFKQVTTKQGRGKLLLKLAICNLKRTCLALASFSLQHSNFLGHPRSPRSSPAVHLLKTKRSFLGRYLQRDLSV